MGFSMMKEMHWSWQELQATPLQVYLSIAFINGRVKAYENLQTLKRDTEKKN